MYHRCMLYVYILFYNIVQVYVSVFWVAEEKNTDILATYACTYIRMQCRILPAVGGTKAVTSPYPSTILVEEHRRQLEVISFSKFNTLMLQTHALLLPLVGGYRFHSFYIH